ncbi:MAG: LGFP repeat-containing protein [Pseudonocardiaceae bacterium]
MATCAFIAEGLIGDRWRLMGGALGPFGCPTGPEMDLGDGLAGRRQAFEGGEIAWMAAQEMVLSVFRHGNEACFEWALAPTSLLHYDYFRFDVLYRRDASTAFGGFGHANMRVHDPKRGRRWLILQGFGEYAFRVKGCDNPAVGSEVSRQGWTALVRLTVGPKPGDPGPTPVTGVIAERWHMFGAWDGPLGRPTTAETGQAGYRVQPFERGVVAALPEFGPEMTVVAYEYGRSVEVHWGYIKDSISVETIFDAINLSSGDGTPEYSERITSGELEWFDWVHDGPSSGRTRFFPSRKGVPWNTEGTLILYLIRLTNFSGQIFGMQLAFTHRAVDARLTALPPDGSPEQAFARHDDRLDQIAEHFIRTRPLVRRYAGAGEDITFQFMALLHLAAKDPDHQSQGQPRSSAQVAVGLREIIVGEMGTNKDYDITLKGLMTVICRHEGLLTEQQIGFVLAELVPKGLFGPHDPGVEVHTEAFVFRGPETENHVLMIESCRYLVNQLQFARTGNAAYNSLDQGLTDWLLGFLHTVAKHDFLEFNSRSYHRLVIHALLNLYEFSTDHVVKVGAWNLLDYAAVKFAVSSSRHRHLGPFRRRKENLNRADDPALNELYSNVGNPQTGFFLAYLGFLEPAGNPGAWFPDGWVAEALIAGLSSYRPPAAAYILAATTQPPAQHIFYHGNRPRQPEGEDADGGLETYYKSPSFLLTAGGMFLNSGSGSDNVVQEFTGTNGVAIAQALTLVPARAHVTFADLVRFDRYNIERAVNTGVHRGFACGANLRVPGTPVGESGWAFVDHTDLGYYVAAYRTPPSNPDQLIEQLDNLGCFYVMELREAADGKLVEPPAPPMPFETFKQLTLERNQLPDKLDYGAAYVFHTADGHSFTFRLWPFGEKYKARVLFMDGQELPENLARQPLADGPYLRAPNGHDGIVEIRHPGCDTPLILDFHNPVHPRRTDNTAACPKWRLDTLRALGERARALYADGRYPDSYDATRKVVAHFVDAGPGLADAYLYEFAEAWLASASAAHPHAIPAQLAAARNAWEVFGHLAGRPDVAEAQRAPLAQRIQILTGLLAFGSPSSEQAVAAAVLVRSLYAGLTDRDHRLDIATSWTSEALFHHEISFNAANPDPPAEQLLQRQTAAEAAAIVFPLAAALPDPAFGLPDLQRMADMLDRLVGLLTFGGPDSAPSVRAAALARHVYTQMADRDHRLDCAATWTNLSIRHHETSFHPACPNPPAEQLSQRRAAAEAADLLFALADPPAGSALGRADLERAAALLDRLIGVLTFGAPTPADPETEHFHDLARRAASLRDEIHGLPPT